MLLFFLALSGFLGFRERKRGNVGIREKVMVMLTMNSECGLDGLDGF